jgi:hypothetical protein
VSPPSPSAAEPRDAGTPLPGAARARLEPRFGHDFGRVRLHTGPDAAELADAFDAHAYTYGRHVVLGGGLSPGTAAGDEALAHELAHVAQGPSPLVHRLPKNPEGMPFQAEVFPAWSTPLHTQPSRSSRPLVDLPRHQVVTVESGKAWLRVTAVVDGKTLSGFISHEQLRQIDTPTPEPEPVPGPVEPSNPELPSMLGVTAEASKLNVRAAPLSGAVLGTLLLRSMRVTVLEEKEMKDNDPKTPDLWYRVRFGEDDYEAIVMGYEFALASDELAGDSKAVPEAGPRDEALRANLAREGWVREDALGTVAMPWHHFLTLLAAYEDEHADQSLRERLIRLRQMGEESDVPADEVIGEGGQLPDKLNLDLRQPDPQRWQLLYEAKQVELPDGDVVDIHHFLLGVEASLPENRNENTKASVAGVPVFDLGENYAAVTWSGDVGAAASDYMHHKHEVWEEGSVLGRTDEEVLRFYYRNSAPEQDLLGDLDAWGAYELLPGSGTERELPLTNLVDFVTAVYGPIGQSAAEHEETKTPVRALGIRNQLTHYGFTSASDLKDQSKPRSRMEEQARIVAITWYQVKAPTYVGTAVQPGLQEQEKLAELCGPLTEWYLDWLEAQASRYGVTLDE